MATAVDATALTTTTATGRSCWGGGRGGGGGWGEGPISPTCATVSILSTGVPRASDAEVGVSAMRMPTIAVSWMSPSACTEAVIITEPASALTCTRDRLTSSIDAMRGRITPLSKLPMSWSRVMTNETSYLTGGGGGGDPIEGGGSDRRGGGGGGGGGGGKRGAEDEGGGGGDGGDGFCGLGGGGGGRNVAAGGLGGGGAVRTPQSSQSVPYSHSAKFDPGPPSSHAPPG
jgi:hypothetical protein